ncbi:MULTISPECIES: hypothetical protein [unclassified Rathayibacter]|uniref:hypothetical protein n=1 Tax=unclassified Rathayibacter TaxID=2609250 RepID=UPI0006F27094|nr:MULTISPECIES: hypothetical protein [unclassified Rathayibacter]KQQ00594.1 hypothetical protein ASF42_14665 [Rathayibacter sp. Leaf294]KQS10793.1 hypothetical protein ASG06_14665 [Rathayibacter sp. Leaf185]
MTTTLSRIPKASAFTGSQTDNLIASFLEDLVALGATLPEEIVSAAERWTIADDRLRSMTGRAEPSYSSDDLTADDWAERLTRYAIAKQVHDREPFLANPARDSLVREFIRTARSHLDALRGELHRIYSEKYPLLLIDPDTDPHVTRGEADEARAFRTALLNAIERLWEINANGYIENQVSPTAIDWCSLHEWDAESWTKLNQITRQGGTIFNKVPESSPVRFGIALAAGGTPSIAKNLIEARQRAADILNVDPRSGRSYVELEPIDIS